MRDDLVKRLDNLWVMLEEEGYYTKANTVVLVKDRIEELEAKGLANRVAIMRLEAKLSKCEALLAKAVEALGEAIYLLDPDEEDIAKGTGLHRIVTTYARLTSSKAATEEGDTQ